MNEVITDLREFTCTLQQVVLNMDTGEFTIGRFYTVYRPLKPGEFTITQPFAAHKAIIIEWSNIDF